MLFPVEAPELIQHIIPRVTVAGTMAAKLREPSPALQSLFADGTADLRQAPEDSLREHERKT